MTTIALALLLAGIFCAIVAALIVFGSKGANYSEGAIKGLLALSLALTLLGVALYPWPSTWLL